MYLCGDEWMSGDIVSDKLEWCFAQCASLHDSVTDARNLLVLHRHPCANLKKIGSMLTKDEMRASPSAPTSIKGGLGLAPVSTKLFTILSRSSFPLPSFNPPEGSLS